jgi:putative ABC transport system substrate-binding protein
MKRRKFITLLGGAAAWPLGARAQQPPKVLRIGTASTFPRTFPLWVAFQQRLRELGYIEGQNLVFDFLELGNQVIQDAAATAAMHELVRRKVDIIVDAGEEVSLRAAMAATSTLPIVILAVSYDPVARGYISSIARPTGNVTGLFLRRPEFVEKQIGMVRSTFAQKTRLAVLWDEYTADQFSAAELTAKSLHMELQSLKLENPPYDFDVAFEAMAQGSAQMVLVLSSSLFALHRPRLAELAIRHRLPTMFTSKAYIHAGGLLSYGPDMAAMFRGAAEYVDRLAKGAKPADLPIDQPTKFELVINLKTAKALGLEAPPTLLALADEVIE